MGPTGLDAADTVTAYFPGCLCTNARHAPRTLSRRGRPRRSASTAVRAGIKCYSILGLTRFERISLDQLLNDIVPDDIQALSANQLIVRLRSGQCMYMPSLSSCQSGRTTVRQIHDGLLLLDCLERQA